MKIRWWPFIANPRVASTRIRCLQVIEGLRSLGLDAGLFDGATGSPDILILSKRYDASSMIVAKKLQRAGTRIVLDLCDNHFYSVAYSKAGEDRAERLRLAISSVDAVIVSTPALAEVVRAECPTVGAIFVIGDAFELPFHPDWRHKVTHPIDELRYEVFRSRLEAATEPSTTRLFWFGNHGSEHAAGGMADLLTLTDVLNRLPGTASLTVVSNHPHKFEKIKRSFDIPCLYLPWCRSTFSRTAQLHDVALIPVTLDPFALCKTNNRLATAILHGLAVAADPVPSYLEFSETAVIGDWENGLAALCESPTMRQKMVNDGQQLLQEKWTLRQVSMCWQQRLAEVVA